jgi:16S rRNA (guanine527-N7)-methyltransferase
MSNAALLEVLERGQELGLLGPGPVADHVTHAKAFVTAVEHRRRVLDLGSGGGVPGLVLATELPELDMTLLDSMTKRCEFLSWAVGSLDLGDRVAVACGRAEELARSPVHRGAYDAVVSRSFAIPSVTAECAVGFLMGPGSGLFVSEPPDTEIADRWPPEGLAVLGLATTGLHRSDGATIRQIEAVSRCPDRFPRRVGVPAKRPLF